MLIIRANVWRLIDALTEASYCGSPLLKKPTTHSGQPRESTGEFSRSVQGKPKLTIKKLRPAYYVRLHAQFCYQTNLYSLMVVLL